MHVFKMKIILTQQQIVHNLPFAWPLLEISCREDLHASMQYDLKQCPSWMFSTGIYYWKYAKGSVRTLAHSSKAETSSLTWVQFNWRCFPFKNFDAEYFCMSMLSVSQYNSALLSTSYICWLPLTSLVQEELCYF